MRGRRLLLALRCGGRSVLRFCRRLLRRTAVPSAGSTPAALPPRAAQATEAALGPIPGPLRLAPHSRQRRLRGPPLRQQPAALRSRRSLEGLASAPFRTRRRGRCSGRRGRHSRQLRLPHLPSRQGQRLPEHLPSRRGQRSRRQQPSGQSRASAAAPVLAAGFRVRLVVAAGLRGAALRGAAFAAEGSGVPAGVGALPSVASVPVSGTSPFVGGCGALIVSSRWPCFSASSTATRGTRPRDAAPLANAVPAVRTTQEPTGRSGSRPDRRRHVCGRRRRWRRSSLRRTRGPVRGDRW